MVFKFFASEFPSKVACEFVCYSIHHMVNLWLLFSMIHQVEYYIRTFNSALVFSILTPILIASSIYLLYLFKNKRIKNIIPFVLLPIFAGLIYCMYFYTLKEIESIDNYKHVWDDFFMNYFYYLFALVGVWIFLSLLQKYLIKWGSRKPESLNRKIG